MEELFEDHQGVEFIGLGADEVEGELCSLDLGRFYQPVVRNLLWFWNGGNSDDRS